MTYLTDISDNITLHFFNPAWAKPTEYVQNVTKVNKNQVSTFTYFIIVNEVN